MNELINRPRQTQNTMRASPWRTNTRHVSNDVLFPRHNTFERPQPGKAEVYGAIIHCITTNRYCLIQGHMTGKWSFPKGHRNTLSEGPPPIVEDPFACVVREVGEEIGIDNLPMPLKEMPLRVGYYYLFEVYQELALNPRDLKEVQTAGWYSLEEMADMNLNIDANMFRSQMIHGYRPRFGLKNQGC
jgi:8-oxo-dGTP pyrophosphatase MutT (NUDIX family)